MKNKLSVLILLIAVSLCGCNGTKLTCKADSDGWQYLFDGKTLKGWVQRGGNARFHVEDGAIVGTTAAPNVATSFLCTEKEYGDFILELEFKVQPPLNSGVQIRSHVGQNEVWGEVVYGYQVDIDPSDRAWSGGIYEQFGREWIYDLKDNKPAGKAFKQNQWNHFHIEAVGDSIKTWINGVPAADLKDSLSPRGIIALQVHRIKREAKWQVRFRNIRIKELD